MRQRALAEAEVQLAGIAFGIGDVFLQRCRRARRRHQYQGRAADRHDRREVLDRIVGEAVGDELRNYVGRRVAVEKRIAIRISLHHRFEPNRGTAAWPIVPPPPGVRVATTAPAQLPARPRHWATPVYRAAPP